MSEIEKLLVVQENDVRIRDIERELKDIPERKRIEEQRLATHKAEVAGAEERLRGRQAAVNELELEAESAREQITKFRRQQLEIKTNKEFKAMEAEIKVVEERIAALEDRELDLMAEVEGATRELGASKRALVEEEAVVKRDVSVWDERAQALQAELKQYQDVRAVAVAEVTSPEWLDLYQRVFERKDRALVPLEGGVCGGCHMQLPPYVLHDAKKQLAPVTCDFCGRMLFDQAMIAT